ncbi:hypothetical protein L21SP5_01640 [Salinivirga cyanobacteriivorans]|uniref:Uncharacterized protein n=1 Tax=Salinivirga cyanobacteriivorans TaxID=1307839 RepID=A0A0S2HYW8_9BACT|nr:choice-of-anchor J domain-containing protein [Salinivirga cyanobacteriivorans]ALO15283.1 hypothetical protein L21SP5_01640 [Salinivirga cyanobacteriivorans]
MKKILSLIISLLALAVLFTACEEEEDDFYTGTTIYVSDTDYYILDPGVSGTINTSKSSIDVEISLSGNVITTVTTQDGAGQYTLTQADLGNPNTGEDTVVRFATKVDGGDAARYVTFIVENPLILDGPSNFYPAEDTTIYLKYSIADDCTAPTSLTITEAVNDGAPVDITGSLGMVDDSIPVNLTPSMINDTLYYTWTFSNSNGTLEAEHMLAIIVKRAWDFEEYDAWSQDFAPWVLEDRDGLPQYGVSAFDYPGSGDPAAYTIFSFEAAEEPEGWEPNSGDKMAFCMAAVPDGGNGNDDWMISDNFDIEDGYELSLYARSITDSYGLERLIIKVVDNADDTETIMTSSPYSEVPTDWTNFKYDLSAFAGKNIRVEIGCVSVDAFALFIDDFEIMTGEGKSVFKNSFENKPSFVPADLKKVRP